METSKRNDKDEMNSKEGHDFSSYQRAGAWPVAVGLAPNSI